MNQLRFLATVTVLLSLATSTPALAQDADTDNPFAGLVVQKDVPFVPTPEAVVDQMLRMAKIDKKDVLYDLGSGDGRIVVTAAKRYGARGVGVDIDPARIADGNTNARNAGVEKQVRFVEGDLFKVDLREATAVTLYLLPSVNLRLRPKLLAELQPGTPVVSHSFDMEDWEPDSTASVDGKSIYAWIIPANVSGSWDVRVNGAPGRDQYRINLRQSYQRVKGTVEFGGKQAPIRTFSLSGNQVTFSFTDIVDGTPVMRRFRGEVNGNAMTGEPGQLRWSARRTGGLAPVAAEDGSHATAR